MKGFVGAMLVVYAVQRGVETFGRRATVPGNIFAPWSLPFIVFGYVSFYMVIVWDWAITSQFSSLYVIVGMTLVVASTFGRRWSIKTLGVYHSIYVEIREHHDLVQSGPYRFVRNPYYLSNIVEVLGLLLIVQFGRAWIMALFLYLPVLVHRLLIEQVALADKFKGDFATYSAKVPALIPRLGFLSLLWKRPRMPLWVRRKLLD